jgi:hypothetical protein
LHYWGDVGGGGQRVSPVSLFAGLGWGKAYNSSRHGDGLETKDTRAPGSGALLVQIPRHLPLVLSRIYLPDANSSRRVLDSGEQGVGESQVKAHRRACGRCRHGVVVTLWFAVAAKCARRGCLRPLSLQPVMGNGCEDGMLGMCLWCACSAHSCWRQGSFCVLSKRVPTRLRRKKRWIRGKLEQPRQDLGPSETPMEPWNGRKSLRRPTRFLVKGNGKSRGMHQNLSKRSSTPSPRRPTNTRRNSAPSLDTLVVVLQIINSRDDPRPSPREPIIMSGAGTAHTQCLEAGRRNSYFPSTFYSIHIVSP